MPESYYHPSLTYRHAYKIFDTLVKTFPFCLTFLQVGPSSLLKPLQENKSRYNLLDKQILTVRILLTVLSLSALLLAAMLLFSISLNSLTALLSLDDNGPSIHKMNRVQVYIHELNMDQSGLRTHLVTQHNLAKNNSSVINLCSDAAIVRHIETLHLNFHYLNKLKLNVNIELITSIEHTLFSTI